jgi:hypothetical protein
MSTGHDREDTYLIRRKRSDIVNNTAHIATGVSVEQFTVTGAVDGASKDVPVRSEVRPQIDTRLVAAVQRGAGAHCHEAAGLLQQYYFCVASCGVEMDSPETGYTVTPDSWALLHRTKGQLRALISQNRVPAGVS